MPDRGYTCTTAGCCCRIPNKFKIAAKRGDGAYCSSETPGPGLFDCCKKYFIVNSTEDSLQL